MDVSLYLFHQLSAIIWQGASDVLARVVWEHVLHHEAAHCESHILRETYHVKLQSNDTDLEVIAIQVCVIYPR